MIQDGFKLPLSDIFPLIESVYSSSDAFCADFEEIYPSEKQIHRHIEDLKSRKGSLFLVAKDQEQLLGYLFLEPRKQSKLRHTADLNMGVSPIARGRGIGRGLLETAIQQASLEGVIEIIYLMVRTDNQHAVRLYDSIGFESLSLLSRDTKVGADYFDGLLMRKFIGNAT